MKSRTTENIEQFEEDENNLLISKLTEFKEYIIKDYFPEKEQEIKTLKKIKDIEHFILENNKIPDDIESKFIHYCLNQSEEEKKKIFNSLCSETGLKKYYEKIIVILKEYMELKEEDYNIIAVWILGTYLHKQFSSFPYLYFNAQKGSGKTRIMKIIASLSKEGSVEGSLSEAVLFRTKGTLCLDEFEGNAQGKENLRLLLNSGYKKGLKVKRAIKNKLTESYDIEQFEVYRPVCLANIWGLENVLQDRAITIIIEKSGNKQITRLIEDFDTNNDFREIRQGLNRLTANISENLNLFGDIFKKWNEFIKNKAENQTLTYNTYNTYNTYDIYNTYRDIAETILSGRDLELSFPLFFTASLINQDILKDLIKTAERLAKERHEIDRQENKDVKLIEFLAQSDYNSYICVSVLVNDIKAYFQEEDWHSKGISRALSRLGLVLDRRTDGKNRQIKIDINKAKDKLRLFKPLILDESVVSDVSDVSNVNVVNNVSVVSDNSNNINLNPIKI